MPANLKVYIVVVDSIDGTESGHIDHVFYREDDAQSRKTECNDYFTGAGMKQYAYVSVRNVF